MMLTAFIAGSRRLIPMPVPSASILRSSAACMQVGSGAKRAQRRNRAASRSDGPGAPPVRPRAKEPDIPPSAFETTLKVYVRDRMPRKAMELYESAESPPVEQAYPALLRALLKMQRVDLALELHQLHTKRYPEAVDVNTTAVCTANPPSSLVPNSKPTPQSRFVYS